MARATVPHSCNAVPVITQWWSTGGTAGVQPYYVYTAAM